MKFNSWRLFCRVSDDVYILVRTTEKMAQYAPLMIHSFRHTLPRKISEAKRIIRGYRCFEEIPNVPDRLRWCRQRLGLKQMEVAEAVGITRGMYTDMENGKNDHYSAKTVDKLAALFKVSPTALLDDYNLFLYQGQGKLIRAYRRQLVLSLRGFADLLGADSHQVLDWEQERKIILKSTWEKYFADRIIVQKTE